VGLAAAVFVLAAISPRGHVAAPGAMISECDGRIRSVAIQYVAGADYASNVYSQLLRQLPVDVTVYALCPDEQAFGELQSRLGSESGRLVKIITHHPMTAWSKDRWVSLRAGKDEAFGTLMASCGEHDAQIWPQRLGDQRIAQDLASVIGYDAVHSSLYFDGGDLLADSRSVFVSPGAIARNVQHTCSDASELKQFLQRQLGLKPILLGDAPDHHVGMFMMAAGENRIVVGDPALARPLYSSIELPGGPDFSEATQRRFDSVAAAARAAGYEVIRIPCVPACDGKTYITYVNGIIDQRDGQRTIYMPTFESQPRLNEAARGVWESLGYRVVPIDVGGTFRLFGTLHCLVNVIARDE
jgi:peptidyl-arginine deiminase